MRIVQIYLIAALIILSSSVVLGGIAYAILRIAGIV